MLLEEFYKYNVSGDRLIADYVYVHTLSCWIINKDFRVYESLIKHYEEQEQYEICEGIHRALDKVDNVMAEHFEAAEKIRETEDEVVYSHEEHQRVSRLVFEDIIKEIYEKQIGEHQKNS